MTEENKKVVPPFCGGRPRFLRDSERRSQFAVRQTPLCHKYDFPQVTWEVREYEPGRRQTTGDS